jgi:hypothetical protein
MRRLYAEALRTGRRLNPDVRRPERQSQRVRNRHLGVNEIRDSSSPKDDILC